MAQAFGLFLSASRASCEVYIPHVEYILSPTVSTYLIALFGLHSAVADS